MAQFPEYPDVYPETSYALGYLEQKIRSLHDRLDGIAAYAGICDDLRQIPIDLGKAIERRKVETKTE